MIHFYFTCDRDLCQNRTLVRFISIRFFSGFVRFRLSMKKYRYLLSRPHFYLSISALSRLLYIYKNFAQKFCVKTMRAIFKNRAVLLYKNFFRNNFVQYLSVWLMRIWAYKNADEKEHIFSWRRKKVRKRTKVDEKRIQ